MATRSRVKDQPQDFQALKDAPTALDRGLQMMIDILGGGDDWVPPFVEYERDPVGFCKNVLGDRFLSSEQILILESIRDNSKTNVQAAHAVGKCVGARTSIPLYNGTWVKAIDLLGYGDFSVPTLDEHGAVVPATARAFDNGKKKVYRLTTETGKTIERTGNHPLWSAVKYSADGCHPIIQKAGWNDIDQLQAWLEEPPELEYHKFNSCKNNGRKHENRERKSTLLCAIPKELPVFGTNEIPLYALTVTAFLIGDGGLTTATPIWTQLQNEQHREMEKCVELMGCSLNLIKGRQEIQYSITGKKEEGKRQENHVAAMLRKFGLMEKGSADKFIPDEIMGCTEPLLAHFLNRLFSTDGWACKRAPSSRSTIGAEVGYSSNSETLIRQIQTLLIRFGIQSNLFYRSKVKNWQLFIHRTGDILEFAKKIGMMGHKGEALKECVEICNSKEGSQQLPKWRTKGAHPGTLWEEITSIEYVGEQPTVGIEVDKYHTYLTDFYEHNSFIASRAVFWWLLAVGGSVYTTAPTEQLVHDVLWGEIRKLYVKKSTIFPVETRQLQLSIKVNESVFATGFTASEYKASTFTGRHADKQLIVMDESSDISQMIDEGFISCLTGSSNRGLRIGNPLVPATPFHFACRTEGSIRITAWNHPNVSWAYEVCSDGIHRLKPEIERDIMTVNENGLRVVKQQDDWPPQYPRDLISGAISIDYIENNARPRGENSAFWLSRIEGIFPTDSSYSIIPTSLFLSARARYDSDPEYWDALASACSSRIGVDVGDAIDPHAYARWQGPVLYSVEEEPTRGDQHDQERCAGHTVRMLKENPGVAHVDRIGVGAAVPGMIQNEGFTAWGVAWSETELLEDPGQFVNIKIENQFDLRKALESGEAVIAPLGAAVEDKLMEEMSATNYENTPSGKVKCELKSKTRKRIGRSTNLFDAVVLGHSHKTSVAAMIESAMKFLS